MEVYVLTVKVDGEVLVSIFKDNTQIKKKLIKYLNEQFNYDCAQEERDRIIEELLDDGESTGDMVNDFAVYYLVKNIVI